MRLLPAILLPLLFALPARADSLTTPTGTYEGAINGLRNGKLSLTPKNANTERLLDLSEITSLSLDAFPKFADAEAARNDPLKAAALYKTLIPTLNKPELKLLAEARAIDPCDRIGNFSEALSLFLDVYLSSPPATPDSLWNLRPTHLPAPPSKMLPEAADKIAAALKSTRVEDARKNLRTLLLQIYTQAGDTDAAQRIAREIATGIPSDPVPSAPTLDLSLAATLNALESDLNKKNFDRVLQQSASLLTATRWTSDNAPAAVQLFTIQARALEAQTQLDLATALWLRIPAHYPDSPSAPNALLHAASLQLKQNHNASAQSLLEELRTQYPTSPENLSLNSNR